MTGGGGAAAHAGAGVLSGEGGRDRKAVVGKFFQRDESGGGAGIPLKGNFQMDHQGYIEI